MVWLGVGKKTLVKHLLGIGKDHVLACKLSWFGLLVIFFPPVLFQGLSLPSCFPPLLVLKSFSRLWLASSVFKSLSLALSLSALLFCSLCLCVATLIVFWIPASAPSSFGFELLLGFCIYFCVFLLLLDFGQQLPVFSLPVCVCVCVCVCLGSSRFLHAVTHAFDWKFVPRSPSEYLVESCRLVASFSHVLCPFTLRLGAFICYL